MRGTEAQKGGGSHSGFSVLHRGCDHMSKTHVIYSQYFLSLQHASISAFLLFTSEPTVVKTEVGG